MDQWVAVHGLQDGVDLNADNLNQPIFELAQRTGYLYSWLRQLVSDSPFGSLRITGAKLSTAEGLAPEVKDVVALDPVTRTYVKAQSTMSLLDVFTAGETAFAVGILVEKQGGTGTIVAAGKFAVTGWAVADLLEPGETFRNGRYYLSASTPGKITATPTGPMIFVGMFVTAESDATALGYALLNPQYRDTGESHVHRAYKLPPQPAGQQYATGTTPSDVHVVMGFAPDGAPGEGEQLPRLVVYGPWADTDDQQYVVWLSTYAGTDNATAPAPESWDDAYLHWISTDPAEGQGLVQLRGFELPVALGTRGLVAVLENPTGVTPDQASDWDVPYAVVESGVESAKRTWTLNIPTETQGWLARRYRQFMAGEVAVDTHFSFRVIGGPANYDDGRTYDTITALCAAVFSTDLDADVIPGNHTGIAVTVGTDEYKFEFTDDGTYEDGSIPVVKSAVLADTLRAMVEAMKAAAPEIVPVLSHDLATVLVGIKGTGSVSTYTVGGSSTAMTQLTSGAGHIGGTADLLVFDQDNVSLCQAAPWIWEGATLWTPLQLRNGLMLLPSAYDAAGTKYSAPGAIAVGDMWTAEIDDPAPGAHFEYSMGMHQALSAFYPPIPMQAGTLELNGVTLDSAEFFPGDATYWIGRKTLYWYPDAYGMVPWPKDWVSMDAPGSDNEQKKMLLHFAKNTIGDTGYVTSLRPAPNSPLKVLRCGTRDNAVVGDLAIDLDLSLTADDVGLNGYQVVKSASGNKLRRGPVVEKIIPGPGITVTQNQGAPAGQGTVTIGLANNAVYTGDFEEVSLENAKQEMIGMFPYVRLLGWTTGGANTPTAFTAKFRVPHTIENKPYRVVVYATVFGETDVPYVAEMILPRAGLAYTYAVLPDVYPVGTAIGNPTNSLNLVDELLMPDASKQVEVVMGNAALSPAYKAFDPMLIHNYGDEQPSPNVTGQRQQVLGSPFPNPDDIAGAVTNIGVRPGSLVAVRFARANLSGVGAGKPEYTGALGFINLRWMLVSVS